MLFICLETLRLCAFAVPFLSPELGEKADVIFDEEADVFDAPADHGEAVEAHAEGEAGDFFRIKGVVFAGGVDGSKNGWIDHAAARDFDPTRGLAFNLKFHIDLERWLGEGEEVRAEADWRGGAEHFAEEVFESAFEIGEGDVGIDEKAFELVEDGEVGGVDLIAAVSGAGCDDADGRRGGFHRADLDAGGVSAEEFTGIKIERVFFVAGGVVGGSVQCIEAMVFVLDFRAIG